MVRWVRPVATTLFSIGLTVGFFMGKIPVEVYAPIATAVILFWFKARDEDKIKKG